MSAAVDDVGPCAVHPLDLSLEPVEGQDIFLYDSQDGIDGCRVEEPAVFDPIPQLEGLVVGVSGQVHPGMELSYVEYARWVYPPHGYILPEDHLLECPDPGEVRIFEEGPDVVDAGRVAVEHAQLDGSGPHGGLINVKFPLPVRPLSQAIDQVVGQSNCVGSECRASHVVQNVIHEFQVVDNRLRHPLLGHLDENMAFLSTSVVLVHLGYLGDLFLLIRLVDAHAVHPHVLDVGRDHQAHDVSQLILGDGHVPVDATDPAVVRRYLLAPGVGEDLKLGHIVSAGVDDKELAVAVAQQSQREGGRHGKYCIRE